MLRLVKKFDLMRDIYDQIPDAVLRSGEEKLTPESCRLSIVGHERTGHIIVTYDGYTSTKHKVTFFDVFDPDKKTRRTVYRHTDLITCVSASISESHSLLAVVHLMTVTEKPKHKERKDGERKKKEKNYEFHSLVVELRKEGKYYKTGFNKGVVHRVQFLYMRKPGMFYLLYFFEQSFVHLYQIPSRHLPAGIQVTAHPNLIKVIAKNFFWYEWDRHRNLLYLLQPRRTGSLEQAKTAPSSSPVSDARSTPCTLRCVYVPDKVFEEVWEVPLKVKLPTRVTSTHPSNLFYGYDRRARLPSSRFFHVVRLDGNAYCLCQQHPVVDELATSIKVTLFLLHEKGRLDINIPMNNFDYETISRTRVFFGPIGSMVVVYIPDVYMQFVYCGANHPLYLGLTLPYRELATSLPTRRRASHEGIVAHTRVVPFSRAADAGNMAGHCLLDCMRGIIYEYLIDRSAVLSLFQNRPDFLHVPALHLVLVLMQDKELADEILNLLCTNYPYDITPLLREFLIASPYIKAKNTRNTPQQLLSIMPVTSLTPIAQDGLAQRLGVNYSELRGYTVLPSTTKLTITNHEQVALLPRFQHDQPPVLNPEIRYIEFSTASTSPSRVSTFFKGLLNISSTEGVVSRHLFDSVPKEDLDSTLSKGRAQLLQNFSAYVNAALFSKTANKERVAPIVTEYRYFVTEQANALYEKISTTMRLQGIRNKSEAMLMYQVLESLYCALEELRYPCPQGFSHTFVSLGKESLPRSVFLQYIERGIFTLNVHFVEKVVRGLSDTEEDRLFKYELLSHLNDREKSLAIMRNHQEYVDYLLQYHLSKLPIRAPTEEEINQPIDLESTHNKAFIPRAVFINAIRERFIDVTEYQSVISLIDKYEDRLYTTIINLAHEVASMEGTGQL